MSTTIDDRFILVLVEAGEPHGYWQGLERRTGIPAQSWRKAYARRQRPTLDMISAICRLRPEYAFWIATGITDAMNGHTAPVTALTFPEMPRKKLDDQLAQRYFQMAIEMSEQLETTAGLKGATDDVRYIAYSLTQVGNGWWATGIVKDAYDVAGGNKYQELLEVHSSRESHRMDKTRAAKGLKHPELAEKLALPDPRTSHQEDNDLFWKPAPQANKTDGNKQS